MSRACFALLLALLVPLSQAGQTVRVGAAAFPPYIDEQPAGQMQIELLDLMNAFQQKYHFTIVNTNPIRRFHDFDQGLFDVSFYDDLSWGWKDRSVEATPVFLIGSERYVALAAPERDQSFFDSFKKKRILGIRGYHYGFAGFNADPAYLKKTYSMVGTLNNDATLKQLLAGYGDIALITDAHLQQHLAANPALHKQLLIADKPDQIYRHTIIVRKGFHPSAQEISQILDKMQKAGALKALWDKYGRCSPQPNCKQNSKIRQ